jgi:prevent-host-death family protein
MAIISIHDAKTNLSKLIARACQGEEIIIARGKEPVVRLQPVTQKPRRKFGSMRGRVAVDASFFEPLSDEELDAWNL